MDTNTNMAFAYRLERESSEAEPRSTVQGDSGAHYSGGLFDLLMGEHCIESKDVCVDKADVLGSDDPRAGPSMSEGESRVCQAAQAVHSNNPPTQPFPGISDHNFEPGTSNIRASRGKSTPQ